MSTSSTDRLSARQPGEETLPDSERSFRILRVVDLSRRLRWRGTASLLSQGLRRVPARLALWLGQLRPKKASESGEPVAPEGQLPSRETGRAPSPFLIVLEARDKATSNIRGVAKDVARLESRIVSSSSRKGHAADGGLAVAWNRVTLVMPRLADARRWLPIALAMLVVLTIPLLLLQVISRGPEGSARQGSGQNSAGPGDASGSQESNLIVGTPVPGSNFNGAYVLEVSRFPTRRAMLRVFVPEGLNGQYYATVKLFDEYDFQCVTILERLNELFCVGPELPAGTATISVYQIFDGEASSALVFEISYYVVGERLSEPGIPVLPTPEQAESPYGIGFTWPDRLNEAEIKREPASNSTLARASALITMSVMGVWFLPRYRDQATHRVNPFTILLDRSRRAAQLMIRYDIPPAALGFLVYMRTLAHGVYGFDSAELATGAYSLGIVHPTGYPLYLMMAKLFTFLPYRDVAFRVNIFSAVMGAATIWLLARLSYRITRNRAAAWIAAGMMAFAYTFWSMSIVAEVYTLHTALLALCLICLDSWLSSQDDRWFYGLVLIFGLSLTNHVSAFLFLPALAWPVIRKIGPKRALLLFGRCAPLFLLGLTPYLYLPIRYAADPPLNYVRSYYEVDLTTIEGITWMVTGTAYRFFAFGYQLPEYLNELLRLLGELWRNFTGLGVLLGLVGMLSLFRRRHPLATTILLAFIANFLFFASYAVTDKDSMLLGAWLMWAIWIAEGARVVHRLPGYLSRVDSFWSASLFKAAVGVMIGTVFIMLSSNSQWLDMSKSNRAELYGRQVLESVEEGAFVMGSWSSAVILEYLQQVEGMRPDVEIFNRSRYEVAEYYKHWSRNTPHDIALESIAKSETALVEQALGKRPVYDLEFEPRLAMEHEYQPMGQLFLVQPKNSPQTN